MSSLKKFLQALSRAFLFGAPPRNEIDEAYLAESVDLVDLERRMREIDERTRQPRIGFLLGVTAR